MSTSALLLFIVSSLLAEITARVVDPYEPICLEEDQIGLKFVNEACKSDSDCYNRVSSSTICKSGRCTCDRGFIEIKWNVSFDVIKSVCIYAPGSNSDCKHECQRPFICTNVSRSDNATSSTGKTCQCPSPYTARNGGCYLDCKRNEFYADGKCIERCSANEYAHGSECRKMSNIGGPCKRDDDCSVPYSVCQDSKCACGFGFAPNKKRDACDGNTRTCPYGDPIKSNDAFVNCKVVAKPKGESGKKSAQPRIFPTVAAPPRYRSPLIDEPDEYTYLIRYGKAITDTCAEDQFCMVTSGNSYYPGATGHCCPYPKPECPIGKPHPNASCGPFLSGMKTPPDREFVIPKFDDNPDELSCPDVGTHSCRVFDYGGGFQVGLCCPDACTGGRLLINGRCYPKRQFGDQCDFDDQCRLGYAGGACINGKCTCKKNSNVVEGNSPYCDVFCKNGLQKINIEGDCGVAIKLGEKCDPDFQSACGLNAKCSSKTGTCVCDCGHAKLDSTNCGPEPKCARGSVDIKPKKGRHGMELYTFCVIPESKNPPMLSTAAKQCASGQYCSTYMENLGVCCSIPEKPLCHDGSPVGKSCDPKVSSVCGDGKMCMKYLNEAGPDDPKKYFCCPPLIIIIED